jgi:hypothetical protein
MTVDAFNAPAELRRLIGEGVLTEGGLQSLTGIGSTALRSFISSGLSGSGLTDTSQAFTAEESTRLSILAAQLVDGMAIPDDDRLRGILESLTIELHLTSHNIARLAGLDAADVDEALTDPQSLQVQKKYMVAVRASYLLTAFSRAGNR